MRVAVIMGSDSDLPIMEKALQQLAEFSVDYEVVLASAHRTPEKLAKFISQQEEKGTSVYIAGAGAAAHLPGVVASLTTRPVIGVPIAATSLAGMDALLAIVQMPSGMPVATVAINGSKNAALLALQIGAVADEVLAEKYVAYRNKMKEDVEAKDAALQKKLNSK